MKTVKNQVLKHLNSLVGLKLSIARRAADMRGFHFGRVTFEEGHNRSFGEYALHIQCPWRLEGPDGIVTGRTDLWEPAEADADVDWSIWDYDKNENLQDRRIALLLGGYDSRTRSFINNTECLVVERVEADEFGGATIILSGDYRLVIFPSGSAGEDWRLLRPPTEEKQFVICGGKVDESFGDAG